MAFRWPIKRKLLGLAGATLFPLLLLFGFWVFWEIGEHTADAEANVALASRQAATQIRTLKGECFPTCRMPKAGSESASSLPPSSPEGW
jgi:hypothetical protein